MKKKKEKEKLDKLRESAIEHQQLSATIERLLFAGWLDLEMVADYLATQIIENPYNTYPCWKLKDNGGSLYKKSAKMY